MNKVGICIFILAMVFASTEKLKAQEKGTSQIEIGFGAGTTNDLVDSFGDSFSSIFVLGLVRYENETYSGVYYLGYKYAVIDKLMLGATLAYQSGSKDLYVNDDLKGEQKDGFYTIGIEGNYHYISNPSFQMYSGLGLGYTINREKFTAISADRMDTTDSESYFNFQVTAAGLRFGKTFGGFAELGFGYKGVINAGINYQF